MIYILVSVLALCQAALSFVVAYLSREVARLKRGQASVTARSTSGGGQAVDRQP